MSFAIFFLVFDFYSHRVVKMVTEDEIDGVIDYKDLNLSTLWEMVKDREVWCTAVHGLTKSQT